MAKRRSSLDDAQLGFTFDPPKPARREADLAGLDRIVAATVALALKEDERPRAVIAAVMSALLGEDVTTHMLNGYASESREKVNIALHRAMALFAATERFDLLDALMRRIGAALLVGEEIHAAQLGHIDRQIAELKVRKRSLEGKAKPIGRGSR